MDREKSLSRPLTRRYVVALTVIALLSIGAHVALETALGTQSGAAAEINVSGRQRMLSQRIAFHAGLLASAEGVERDRVRSTLDELVAVMETSHEALLQGDAALGLPGDPSPQLRRIYDGPLALDAQVRRYLDTARRVLDVPPAELSPASPAVLAVQRQAQGASEGDLLPTLDAAVAAYQAETEAEVETVERVALAVLLVTLLALALEGRFVFKPMIDRISERTRSALRARARLQAVLDNALVGVLTVRPDGGIVDANRAASSMFVGTEPLVGRSLWDLASRTGDREATSELLLGALGGTDLTRELELHGQQPFAGRVAARAADGPDGTLVSVVVSDVTQQRDAEAQLRHLALHDPLTGLANRTLFSDRVEHALTRAQRHGQIAAVLFIDLDEFKTVNDSLGHHVGDELLVSLSERMAGAVRSADTAARLGGDEFAVLIEDVSDIDMVRAIADRILELFAMPVEVGGEVLAVGASIGVAVSSGCSSAAELMRNADAAMYDVKRSGRNGVQFFTASMHDVALERLNLRGDLGRAVATDQLALHYQPIVELGTERLLGVEALLRWTHPERGNVPPGTFIPVAEDCGLIGDLGRWVLRRALQDMRALREQYGEQAAGYVSVNVSALQLAQPGFVDDVRAALEGTIPADDLVLEITETALMRDAAAASQTLTRLRDLGVRIAVDDFGTGYSSMSYLQDFPFDLVKIDRSFVARLGESAATAALTRGMLELCRALGLQAVAEGVETRSQAAALADLDCTCAQGYLFARPAPLGQLAAYLDGQVPADAGR